MPTLFESPTKPKPSVVKETGVSHRHSPMKPLTSFAVAPDGVRFETQETDEEVILFLRQHPIVLVPSVMLVAVLLIAPALLLPFFLNLPITIPPGYLVVGLVFWYVMTFGVTLASFLRWFFNIYIVTNQRLVDIDFVHLLYKEFSEARLNKIQDVTYKTGGVLAAFLNYGDVLVQTAAELPNFEFATVPNPEKVIQIIGELSEQFR